MVAGVDDIEVHEALQRLSRATSSRERGEIARGLSRSLGISLKCTYERLGKAGFASGRKPRRDRGASSISLEHVENVASIVVRGRNKRGQANIPVKLSAKVARSRGLVPACSDGHLRRRMRQEGFSLAHIKAPKPGVEVRTTHPNHMWEFDISVAIQWYFRDPATGKRLALYPDADRRFYEGKPRDPSKKVIHRFTIIDHFSGAYYVRYYYCSGEAAEDVIDFLYRAMANKGPLAKHLPFEGIPDWLWVDQGPANKSHLVVNLIEGLGIRYHLHAPGNAQATGGVETRHRHWQTSFEGLLALDPAGDLEQLNERAEMVSAMLNSDPEARHSRHGLPPMAKWNEITDEQLIACPSRKEFFALARAKERTATLTGLLRLQADNREWEVSDPNHNIYRGQKVLFRISPFIEQGIRITTMEGQPLAALELRKNAHGFSENAQRAFTLGDAEKPGASVQLTSGQKLAAAVASGERTVQMEGLFDGMRAAAQVEYLARHAQPRPVTVPVTLIGHHEARIEALRKLGLKRFTVEEADWWKEQVGGGVSRARFAELLGEFTTAARTAAAR